MCGLCSRDAFRKYVEGGLNQSIKISGGERSKSRGPGACPPGKVLKIGAVRLHLEQLLCDMVDKLFSVKIKLLNSYDDSSCGS